MLKFYRIFRIAWKFLAKFVKCRLKKLYYTVFFGKIFRQYFSLRFDIKQQHFLHSLAFFVGICRRMTKNAVIWQRFLILFDKEACVEKYYKNMVSKNVKLLGCRKLVLKNVYKNFWKSLDFYRVIQYNISIIRYIKGNKKNSKKYLTIDIRYSTI